MLNTDYSPRAAAECMNRLAKLSARFIGNRGFSIGIDDVTPAPALQRAKQEAVESGWAGRAGGFSGRSARLGKFQRWPALPQPTSVPAPGGRAGGQAGGRAGGGGG